MDLDDLAVLSGSHLGGVGDTFLKGTASGTGMEHVEYAVFNACGMEALYYSPLFSP